MSKIYETQYSFSCTNKVSFGTYQVKIMDRKLLSLLRLEFKSTHGIVFCEEFYKQYNNMYLIDKKFNLTDMYLPNM